MAFKIYSNKKEKLLKITCLLIVFLILISSGLFLTYQLTHSRSIKIISNEKHINTSENKASILNALIPSKDSIFGKNKFQNKKEVNILILGTKGQDYKGEKLTDTIILAHLEPKNKKVILTSIPRDLLIQIPNDNYQTKINAVYSSFGIKKLKPIIQDITGFKVDNYLMLDLTVVKKIIDSIDGLNVYVPQDINDPYFPTKDDKYQTFKMKAGWRYMDGETTLRYIRSRYTSPNGDFDRMARQQQIINLLKQKVLSLNPLGDFTTYLKIFNNLQNHIYTDLDIWQLKNLWQIAKSTPKEDIKNIVIDHKTTKLLTGDIIKLGKYDASVVYPRAGKKNYEEVKKYIKEKLK